MLERKSLNVGSENELKFTGGANNSFTSMIYFSKSITGCIKWIGEVNIMDSLSHTPVLKRIAA